MWLRVDGDKRRAEVGCEQILRPNAREVQTNTATKLKTHAMSTCPRKRTDLPLLSRHDASTCGTDFCKSTEGVSSRSSAPPRRSTDSAERAFLAAGIARVLQLCAPKEGARHRIAVKRRGGKKIGHVDLTRTY